MASMDTKSSPLEEIPYPEIRWYYSVVEGAASQVTPAYRSFLPFCLLDSVKLETAFLQRCDEIERSWVEAIAAQDAREASSKGKGNKTPPTAVAEGQTGTGTPSTAETQKLLVGGVGVRGGQYEVNLWQRTCLPVYWAPSGPLEASCVVRRGLWFADCPSKKGARLPLREDVSHTLEGALRARAWTNRSFQKSGEYAARVELPCAAQFALVTGESFDSVEVFLCPEGGMRSLFGQKKVRLWRGYEEPKAAEEADLKQWAEDDYLARTPVAHVMLVVHGIGQTVKNADIVKEVAMLRRTYASVAASHLSEHQKNAQRVEIVPVQWRKTLSLDADILLENITLEGVRSLRELLNATVVDVLYYMSPRHCQEIANSVTTSLNKVFGTFKRINPTFDGKVSIFGHSLGSVLVYDILCHQLRHDSTGEPAATTIAAASTAGPGTSSAAREGAAASSAQPGPSLDAFEDRDEDGGAVGPYDGLTWGGFAGGPERRQSWHTSHAAEEEPVMDAATQMERLQQQMAALQLRMDAIKQQQARHGQQEHQQQAPPGGAPGSEAAREDGQQAVAEAEASSRKGRHRRVEINIHYHELDFKVDTFFSVGSPLGMFLVLRGWSPERVLGGSSTAAPLSPGASEEYLPSVRRVINLFHPHDPVAYRLEPLISGELGKLKPEKVISAGSKHVQIGPKIVPKPPPPQAAPPPGTAGEVKRSLRSAKRSLTAALFKRTSDGAVPVADASTTSATSPATEAAEGAEAPVEVIPPTPPPPTPLDEMIMERLTGDPKGRLDHSLQEPVLAMALSYYTALSAHFTYWTDADTALFLIRHFYQEIPAYTSLEAQQMQQVVQEEEEPAPELCYGMTAGIQGV
eukprot:jgi/Mesvir1/2149/Mv16668-RA.1